MYAANNYAKKEPGTSQGGLLVGSVLTPGATHGLPQPHLATRRTCILGLCPGPARINKNQAWPSASLPPGGGGRGPGEQTASEKDAREENTTSPRWAGEAREASEESLRGGRAGRLAGGSTACRAAAGGRRPGGAVPRLALV